MHEDVRCDRDRRGCGGRERRRPRSAGRAHGRADRERAGGRRVLLLGVHAVQGAAAGRARPAGGTTGERREAGGHGRARRRGDVRATQHDRARLGRRIAGRMGARRGHRAHPRARPTHRRAHGRGRGRRRHDERPHRDPRGRREHGIRPTPSRHPRTRRRQPLDVARCHQRPGRTGQPRDHRRRRGRRRARHRLRIVRHGGHDHRAQRAAQGPGGLRGRAGARRIARSWASPSGTPSRPGSSAPAPVCGSTCPTAIP